MSQRSRKTSNPRNKPIVTGENRADFNKALSSIGRISSNSSLVDASNESTNSALSAAEN